MGIAKSSVYKCILPFEQQAGGPIVGSIWQRVKNGEKTQIGRDSDYSPLIDYFSIKLNYMPIEEVYNEIDSLAIELQDDFIAVESFGNNTILVSCEK